MKNGIQGLLIFLQLVINVKFVDLLHVALVNLNYQECDTLTS